MELKEYLVGDVRDSVRYIENMSRGGAEQALPLIITCALSQAACMGEANPICRGSGEQVREAYDAYNAGASMVHIHRRNPENPMQMSWKWEEFAEINTMVRAKCRI